MFLTAVLISGASMISGCTQEREAETNDKLSAGSGKNSLYFVEKISDGGSESGRSSRFSISGNGGSLTAVLRTSGKIGINAVDVRVEREYIDGSEIVETESFDVNPDKNYFVFDKLTLINSGDYRVTVMDKNGNVIAIGKVRIEIK